MHQTASFHPKKFASIYSIQSYILYTGYVFFEHLPFQAHDPTQPTKPKIFDPFPTQPNPRVNPIHGQL